MTGSAPVTRASDVTWTVALRLAPAGTVDVGGACASDAQCTTGFCATTFGSCGLCEPPPAEGDPCGDPDSGEVSGSPFELLVRTPDPRSAARDADLGEDLRRFDRRLECVDEEIASGDDALPARAADDDVRPGRDEDRRPIRRGVGVGARSADRPPVADLRVADAARRLDDPDVAGDGGMLEDLAVGGPPTDAELVVGLDDAVDPGHVLDVDEDPGLGETEFQQRQEAVAARQDLGLAFVLLQRTQGRIEVRRPDVIELRRDHGRLDLLAPVAGDLRTAGTPAD